MTTCRRRMLLLFCFFLVLPAGCAGIGPTVPTPEVGMPEQTRLAPPEGEVREEEKVPILGPSSTLEDYLTYAALHNPDLKAAFHVWKAKLERIPQVEQFPDPRFNYAYFIRNVETRVGPQRHKFGISQVFPWFGKLKLRGGVAFEQAEAARMRYEARKWRLFYAVQKAYSAYYDLGRSIEITKENIDLVNYLEQVARARYQVGTGGYADVIKAQVEQGLLADRLRTLEEQIAPLVAELNAQMNNPLDFPLPIPQSIPEFPLEVPEEQLFAWLPKSNPEVRAITAEVEAGKLRQELAGKRFYPDIMLGFDYIETGTSPADPPENGKDPIVARFSLNLPIWRESYRAGVRQAIEETSSARLRKIERINLLGARLKTALFNYHDADRKVQLYRDTLIPKAEQSLKATESAFKGGTRDFLSLIDTQRVLLEFQLTYERMRAKRATFFAEIEMLVGRSLRSTDEPDAPPPPSGEER